MSLPKSLRSNKPSYSTNELVDGRGARSMKGWVGGCLLNAVFAMLMGCGANPGAPDGVKVEVAGEVTYQERIPTEAGLSADFALRPVRFACIELRSEGTVRAKGTTDSMGCYRLCGEVGDRYQICVLSRCETEAKLDVVDSDGNTHRYAVQREQSVNCSSFDILIPCDSRQQSGAFNILDVCRTVSRRVSKATGRIPPHVTVCWELGNVGTIVQQRPVTSSFYGSISGEPWIVITGGEPGRESTTETSHFDDPVIAHEYSHFIQDHFSYANSMGGSHNAEHLYFPLALAEGFATWLGCVALGRPYYICTIGMPPTPQLNFSYYSLESVHDISYRAYGYSSELSVSEILWDLIDGGEEYPEDLDNDGIALSFQSVFSVFVGFSPQEDYPWLGLFLQRLEQLGLLSAEQIAQLVASPTDHSISYPSGVRWPFTLEMGRPHQFNVDIPGESAPSASSAFANQFWTFILAEPRRVRVVLDVTPFDPNPPLSMILMHNNNRIVQKQSTVSYPLEFTNTLSSGTYIVRIVSERSTSYSLNVVPE